MVRFLRQSTAIDLPLGPFLDSTDGVTPEPGLTIAQADVRLKKNNGNWANVNDATSATHEEDGWYEKEYDATDTNTVGALTVSVQVAGACPVWHHYFVLRADVYDGFFSTGAFLQVDVQQYGGAAGTFSGGRPEVNVSHAAGTAWNSGAIGASTFAANAINAAKLDPDVTVELQSGLATAASITSLDSKIDTIDNFLDTEMAAVKAVTDKLDTALEADGGVWRFTTNALEQAPAGGGGGSTPAQITDEVYNRADGVEGGITFIQAQRAILAVLAGQSVKSGTTRTFKNPAGTITRVTATVPSQGNRTAITLNL